MSTRRIPRRHFLHRTALTAMAAPFIARAATRTGFRIATFSAEVTPPFGHALMGGGISPAKEIVDPLFARGLVLLGGDKPVVLVSVEWCEIRNDAYDRWRELLAAAAGTTRERVFVTSTHVHDAPVADLTAERLLREAGASGSVCNPEFHEQTVQRVARALGDSLSKARSITHVGTGRGRVEQVASNRRYTADNGTVLHNRMSATRDPAIRAKPEGAIDPWLRTLSFWDREKPVAAWSTYAVHPMSYYGKGGISADFPGLARTMREKEAPGVFQIYASGCSGNVIAGKYNDGAPENRPVLARRLHDGMVAAWKDTHRTPLETLAFRNIALELTPRSDAGFSEAELKAKLASKSPAPFTPFQQCLAAMGLSWRQRVAKGQPIDVPSLNLGPARLLLLPGEAYVEYQLFAQQYRPDSFVVTLGYGESATGYIPIERAWEEKDSNLHDWCWVAPGSEAKMQEAIRRALA